MKKILFLPFLQMPSGHHAVAEALMDAINKQHKQISLVKIDLLSYTNESLEKFVTTSYLNWIRYAPETYDWAYKKLFYLSSPLKTSFRWYHVLFQAKLERLIEEAQPDLIVCTHCFPSMLLNQLKRKGKCHIPVVNVYTDFFINDMWGREEIDFHCVPSQDVKKELLIRHHIPKQKIIVTGIPVHDEIKGRAGSPIHSDCPNILIAGGNSGLGDIRTLLADVRNSTRFHFYVLCGNNQSLYKELTSWNLSHITPLAYITSRSEMNALYDSMDAIITKPGGATISEGLRKQLPIFVHSKLPGQEEINFRYLTDKGLIFNLTQTKVEQQLRAVLENEEKIQQWKQVLFLYEHGLEIEKTAKIADFLVEIMDEHTSITNSMKMFAFN